MRKPVFFTIWADLTDYEGKDLLQKVHEYQEHPVIVAKRISVSHYRGCRFATRFNSTISIDPPYPQAKELMNWAKENEQLLIPYILKSSSDSPIELNLAPFEDEIVSISTIPVASSEQTFFLEGEMSLANDLQTFYVLVCSGCKHMVRHRQQKVVTCINCEQRKMLIPSCEFEAEITDASGTVSAIISEKLAERILAMTAAEVYETTVVKRKLLPVQHITEQLANKTFKIHLQKSQSRSPDKEVGTLVSLTYTRTHTMFDSPESSATMTIGEGSKRNIECVTSVEEDHSSSTKRQKVEPTTPRKKQ